MKQLLVHHHAAWLRAANQIVATESSRPNAPGKAVMKKFRKAARRRGNYWKSKAQKDKKELTDKYNQLVLETSVYVQSKRRKSTATRRRMTLFGGPGFAKFVLFAFFACYFSIPRFCVPMFEYFECIVSAKSSLRGSMASKPGMDAYDVLGFSQGPRDYLLVPHDI